MLVVCINFKEYSLGMSCTTAAAVSLISTLPYRRAAVALLLSLTFCVVVSWVLLSNKTSTSYSRPQIWTEASSDVSTAVAHIRLVIKDFSFMRVTEVDPVNYAAVIGAAGGAWRKFGSR